MNLTYACHGRVDYTNSRSVDGDSDYGIDNEYIECKDYINSALDNKIKWYSMLFIIYLKSGFNIFCVFGIFCNSVFIMVLAHHGFKDTTNILLASISVSDIVFFTTQIVQLLAQIANVTRFITGQETLEFLKNFVSPWNLISVTSSLCLVAVMALERLTAVCFPFTVSHVFTPFRIKGTIFTLQVCIITLVYMDVTTRERNAIHNVLATPDFPKNDTKTMFNNLVMSFDPVILLLFPIAVILMCYIVILLKLQLAAKNLKRMTSSGSAKSSRQNSRLNKLNKMLLVLMTVTLLSFLPPPSLNALIFKLGDRPGNYDSNLQNIYHLLGQVCQLVFSSANSVVCVVMSSSFAKTFKQIVCRD